MKKTLPVFYLLITGYLLSVIAPSPVWAQCYQGPQGDVATIGCLESYIQSVINFLFPLISAVALFFLLLGGIRFITSGGDPKAVEGAKKTMTYALLGLAVIFLVFFIIKGVLYPLTGWNLLQYDLVR